MAYIKARNNIMKLNLYIAGMLCAFNSHALKIDRVIVATDINPMYLHFWPIVAQAWEKKVGIKPTLALIASSDTIVDESIGEVFRFEPIPGVPTSLYAQAIRVLLPALFEDEVSLTSDIDMVPLSPTYFIAAVQHLPDHCFVTYMNRAYPDGYPAYPICYNAAKGSTFKEIFNINSVEDIVNTIKQWHTLGLGWQTDERMLYKYLMNWKDSKTRFIKLHHKAGPHRVDRADWRWDKQRLQKNYYIDAHCLRPYPEHKERIDQLLIEAQILKAEER